MSDSDELLDTDVLLESMGRLARESSIYLRSALAESKRDALLRVADSLWSERVFIADANVRDMESAQKKGLTLAQLDRLYLDESRIESMVSSVRLVASFADPVGEVLRNWQQPNGLRFEKVSVPIGVIGVIYESRPNVTADAASLCFKAGNSVILRSGSESFESAEAILASFRIGLGLAGFPESCIQLIPSRDRAAVGSLLRASDYVDVIIPRGGKSLIERVQQEARMAVFAHLDGLCHTYIDEDADIAMAKSLVLNAKLRRVGICGATETLLVHRDFLREALADIVKGLLDERCEVRGCEIVCGLDSRVVAASESDWSEEYLDRIISVKVVDDLEGAIEHINFYGSHHTDAIISDGSANVKEFMDRVDSAIVLHNASTQFADGGEFGMGAEVGISTGRIHARGPVGVDELTIFKYRVYGEGHCRP